MARAKRTDRTDAAGRRRYRAQQAEPVRRGRRSGSRRRRRPTTVGAEPDARRRDGLEPASRRGHAGPRRPPPAGGIRNAFRLRSTPPNVREDLALLPRLLVHRAFWLPVLIAAIVAGVIVGVPAVARPSAGYPRPVLPGARHRHRLGVPGRLPRAAGELSHRPARRGDRRGVLHDRRPALPAITPAADPSAVIAGPDARRRSAALFFAAAAAWYRRFLDLANPTRQAPAAAPGRPAGTRQARR